jgi:hypothetical protein
MNASRMLVAIVVLAAVGLSAGCTRKVVYKEKSPEPPVVIHDHDHGGPPPHAPAHGYRHKHEGDDVVLVYDKHLDVYIVSGYRDCYYTAGQYFRFVDGSWEWSVSVSTGWKIVADYREVPSSLCSKHGKGKSHGNKDKGKGKKKH